MNNAKKYVKLYLEVSEESFKEWGYYYPPRDWNEFEDWNNKIFREHLTHLQDEVIKTKSYISLFYTVNDFSFYNAFQNQDYEILNNALYQTSRQKLLATGITASGSDHCNALMDALLAFACNDFKIIDHFFPKELPHSKGEFYTENSVNLIKVLYYDEADLKDEAVKNASHFLNKKITLWEKYVVLYLLALLHRDLPQINHCLKELCVAYQKLGKFTATKLDKCIAFPIHGLYRLAQIIDADFFSKMTYPKHPSFLDDFEIWQKDNYYSKGKLFYVYPKEMDYLNKIIEAQLPFVTLTKSQNSYNKKESKDVERFAEDLTENVKKPL